MKFQLGSCGKFDSAYLTKFARLSFVSMMVLDVKVPTVILREAFARTIRTFVDFLARVHAMMTEMTTISSTI